MRGALAVGFALALAAPASADVLVPADPSQPLNPSGVTAAGDVIAFTFTTGTDAFEGERPLKIAGNGAGVAAASDGTAVLTAESMRYVISARVRRPGHGFANRVRLGGPAGVYALAAAPGGWIAAAWERKDGDGIAAAVVDPSGAVRGAVLDRASKERFSIPVVGIDASGRTTVAWTHGRHVRYARSDQGWKAVDRETNGMPTPDSEYAQVGLAVTPSGHSLLAWATPDGIRASADDAQPVTLATARSPAAPTAALAEDGSAVIAYAAGAQTFAVDRAQTAPWSAPHPLGAAPAGADLSSTLAADGRALVGWATEGIAIASGHAGGAWAPAAEVASPVRLTDRPPNLALDASGNPFALWYEFAQSTLVGRIHGARLVPAATLDTTAPTLTTRLPKRVEVARDGAFSFRVPVTCSEACDVRVNVLNASGRGAGYDLRELSLPAGRKATVRLSPSPYDERVDVRRQRPKRIRIVVEAADRAGNLATAAVTARVQRR